MKSVAEFRFIGALCLGLMAAPTFAGDAGLPVVQGQGSLTVSGDGYWHRDTYQSGEQPELSAYTSNGQQLPDGEYRFELRMIPANTSSAARQQDVLRGKSGDSGFNKQQPVPTVSGQFQIQGGQVVIP